MHPGVQSGPATSEPTPNTRNAPRVPLQRQADDHGEPGGHNRAVTDEIARLIRDKENETLTSAPRRWPPQHLLLSPKNTPVDDIMQTDFIAVGPDESIVRIVRGCIAWLLIRLIGARLSAALSLLSVVVLAVASGATIPLVLERLDIDPAMATGVFITTRNDILSVAVFFVSMTALYL
jgi:hypothetical protein